MMRYRESNDLAQDIKGQKEKKVFLWGQEGLHITALGAFLKSQRGYEVIYISDQQSEEQLHRRLMKEKPCAVIFFEEDCENIRQLYAQLLAHQPEPLIIALNMYNNIAEINGRQSMDVKEAVDFLYLIDAA
jgi:hypothetical protein